MNKYAKRSQAKIEAYIRSREDMEAIQHLVIQASERMEAAGITVEGSVMDTLFSTVSGSADCAEREMMRHQEWYRRRLKMYNV